MTEIGYTLSCEEHPPRDLVRYAQRAEEAGFSFATISDHFYPWVERQGQSPFAWSVLGGVAHATERLRVGTGVTCPLIRYHPAIIAQAAATVASMMEGRFFLGLGTGENLNEHVVGQGWPPAGIRQDMLEEAVDIIRQLWSGEVESYRGTHYTLDHARIFTLPENPPPIMIAAAGTQSAKIAGRLGDGLISVAPQEGIVRTFRENGGEGKPTYGQLHVCWARDDSEARRTAFELWPNAAVKGELGQELPLLRHHEQAASMVTEEEVAQTVTCSSRAEDHISAIKKYVDAGFDHIFVHQVGTDQEGFFSFYEQEILPEFKS